MPRPGAFAAAVRRAVRVLLPLTPPEAESPADAMVRRRAGRPARPVRPAGRASGRPLSVFPSGLPGTPSSAHLPAPGAPGAPGARGPLESLVGVHGLARLRAWEAVVVVHAPGPPGVAEAGFVALADGTILADGSPGDALARLAAAVAETVGPPFRAQAVLREPGLWAVGANPISVVELPAGTPGAQISLALHDGERSLVIDDDPSDLDLPELERLGAAAAGGPHFVARAARLHGDAWELEVEPL